MDETKENLQSDANEKLKNKALEYLLKYTNDSNTLKQNRQDSLAAYNREPYPEDARIAEGSRSKFVTSDFFDTVEWILPSLMRIFTAGKEVVKIEGQGPEDEDGAELLNEKVNWDFMRQNNGFLVLYDWFKASMLNKFSIVKYHWERRDDYKDKAYKDLSDGAWAELQNQKDFTVIQHDETVIQPPMPALDEMGKPMLDMMGMPQIKPQVATHTVKGQQLRKRIRRPVAEVVPPEEFICSLKMRDLASEEFYAHGPIKKHKVDLMREYGLKESDLQNDGLMPDQADAEVYKRFQDLGGVAFFRAEEDGDFYYIYECYTYDEERNPVILTLFGNKLIRKQDNDGTAGFCLNSPVRMPHRAIGMSIYDLVGDIQKLRTALTRFICNNIYYQTDGMLIVNEWMVNILDFATQRRPGGVIRTKDASVRPQDAVWPVPVQPLAGHVFGFLDRTENMRENRTGVTRYNQGMDADSLNKTARGISEIMAASQQRVELIARIFAETGVKDLMIAFAKMNVKHLDIAENIRLNNQWVNVLPDSIDVDFDCTVDVALGTGSKEVKVQQMTAILDRAINPVMFQTGVVQPNNLYEMWKAMLTEMGYKNVEKFITDPATLMPMGGMLGPGLPGEPGGEGAGVPQGTGAIGPGEAAA